MNEEEKIIYRTRLHWVMLLGPAVIMLLSGLVIPTKGMSAVIVLALATVWGVFSSISLDRSEFVLTRENLRIRTGFPWRRSYVLPVHTIESVNLYQPSLGKVLNFGKVTLKQKEGRRYSFRMVRDPYSLGEAIYRCKEG